MSTLRAEPRYFAPGSAHAGRVGAPPRAQKAAQPVAPQPAAPVKAAVKPAAKRSAAAPSRLAFRLERLWLTPFVRLVVRLGLPVFVLTLGLGFWLGDAGRRADLYERYSDLKLAVQNRPEFRLERLAVSGAGAEVEGAVRALLPVSLPVSRFALDLESYRNAILRLDAVKSVALVVEPGGALQAKITERVPVILWRTASGIEMLDIEGHRVASLTRRDARPDLPLIAGVGAERAVPEALSVLAAAQPILPRARGLVRVGERRWDLVLDRDQRILLPAQNPVQAIERTLALDSAEDLLSRDFTQLDLRLAARPTIRLSAPALAAWREITGQAPGPSSDRKTEAKASP